MISNIVYGRLGHIPTPGFPLCVFCAHTHHHTYSLNISTYFICCDQRITNANRHLTYRVKKFSLAYRHERILRLNRMKSSQQRYLHLLLPLKSPSMKKMIHLTFSAAMVMKPVRMFMNVKMNNASTTAVIANLSAKSKSENMNGTKIVTATEPMERLWTHCIVFCSLQNLPTQILVKVIYGAKSIS